MQEFSKQKKCKLWNPISIFRSFHFLKQTKTPTISQVFFCLFSFYFGTSLFTSDDALHVQTKKGYDYFPHFHRCTTTRERTNEWTFLRHAHGLRTPNEAFFSSKSRTFGLVQTIWAVNFVGFGVFLADLSAPILVLLVSCPCFPLINHCFYKKLRIYMQIPNIYLGLGFEFGPQRIRDLSIVCP